MGIILWLVMGALVGWIASILMGTDGRQGALMNIVVGIVGAAIGGFLSRMIGGSGADINNSLTVMSFVTSLLGAVVLLGILRAIRTA